MGFHRAGMAKIAARAKMSPGHIYHYFESKEAIIAAIVDRESAKAAERFAELDAVDSNELASVMTERAIQSIEEKTDILQSALNMEMLAECQRNPESIFATSSRILSATRSASIWRRRGPT